MVLVSECAPLDENHNLFFFFAIDDEQIKNELLIYLNEVKKMIYFWD